MGYLYIIGTIIFTVYGQLILKWRMNIYGELPVKLITKLTFLFKLFFDPYILSGVISAFFAAIFWMAAMTKFDISYAYPFMSISFLLVFLFSVLLFGESVSYQKILGIIFIIIGIFFISKSS